MTNLKFRRWFDAEAERFFALIDETRGFDDEGRVAITLSTGFIPDETVITLFAALERSEETNEHILKRAIRNTLFSKDLPKGFTKREFLELVSKTYCVSRDSRGHDYIVVSGLHMTALPARTNFRFEDAEVGLHAQPDDFLRRAIDAREEKVKAVFLDEPPPVAPNFYLTAAVSAESPTTAFYLAKQRIDEIRGLMNFVFNKTKVAGWGTSNGPLPPLNDIREARHITVHNSDGAIAEGAIWFYRDWRAPDRLIGFETDNDVRQRNFDDYFVSINQNHGLSNLVRSALRMYCRALDSTNPTQSFLELWVVLEKLSGISRNEPHAKIIDRVCGIYKDSWLSKIALNQLVDCRNTIAHTENFLDEDDTRIVLHRLNRVVCDLIRLFGLNKMKLESLEEMRKFLDAPSSSDLIQANISTWEKVLTFRGADPKK